MKNRILSAAGLAALTIGITLGFVLGVSPSAFAAAPTGDYTQHDVQHYFTKAVNFDGNVTFAAGAATQAVSIASGTGDVTVTSTDDISITATDDVSLNGGSAGSLVNVGTNTHGNAIHIGDNDTTADTITIGSAKDTSSLAGISVTVGSTGTTSALVLQSGTGDVNITSADDLNIAANASATDVVIGNETGASSLSLKAGTGNIAIDGVAATTITIGDAAQTGAVSLGASTGDMTLNLGTGTGVHTINLGTGGTGADVITIGGNVGTVAVDSGDWDISTAGNMSGFGTAAFDGNVTLTSGLIQDGEAPNGDTVLTTAACGSFQFVGATGDDFTLPAPTNGCKIRFVVDAAFDTTAMTIVTASSSNVIYGAVDVNSTLVACSAEDTITIVESAELPGDYVELLSDGTNWYVSGAAVTTGAVTCTQAS